MNQGKVSIEVTLDGKSDGFKTALFLMLFKDAIQELPLFETMDLFEQNEYLTECAAHLLNRNQLKFGDAAMAGYIDIAPFYGSNKLFVPILTKQFISEYNDSIVKPFGCAIDLTKWATDLKKEFHFEDWREVFNA